MYSATLSECLTQGALHFALPNAHHITFVCEYRGIQIYALFDNHFTLSVSLLAIIPLKTVRIISGVC